MSGTLSSALDGLVGRVEEASFLDGIAGRLGDWVRSAVKPAPVTDALSGTWLGHPLHPLLVAIPIGSWVGASVLDVTGGDGAAPAARRLVGLGLLAALPTAASGASDWSSTQGAERRVGLVHATANVSAVLCYGLSWMARRRGTTPRAARLALAGAGCMAVGGYLGGHLSYAEGVGVDTTAFRSGPDVWEPAALIDEVPDGELSTGSAGGVSLVLARDGDRVDVLDNRCTHRGGPLSEGEREDGCVVCPWHRSTFRLDDGAVVRGPATRPQPAYETRTAEGRVEVRRSESRSLRTSR